jgi:hypothetical protein
VNSRRVNLFTGAVIAVLVMLSVILTASVLFPAISGFEILAVLIAGVLLALLLTVSLRVIEARRGVSRPRSAAFSAADRATWRMPALDQLPPARLTLHDRVWLIVLRGYLCVAAGLVLVRIVLLLTAGSR